ncbi:hypothetical protein FA497_29890, partial [Pseudomonas aeruginosa]|nr:hypothetical protein [Pseudomonas aeruginosa]
MILSRYLMPALRYTADGLRRPGVAAEKWLRLALDQLDWRICINSCLLYTSDAADDKARVDL